MTRAMHRRRKYRKRRNRESRRWLLTCRREFPRLSREADRMAEQLRTMNVTIARLFRMP